MTKSSEPAFYVAAEPSQVDWLRAGLKAVGLNVLTDEGLLPGEDRFSDLRFADAVLFIFAMESDGLVERLIAPLKAEVAAWELEDRKRELRCIPVLIGDVDQDRLPPSVARLKPIQLPGFGPEDRTALVGLLQPLIDQLRSRSSQAVRRTLGQGSLLQVRSLELTNIGCFQQLKLSLAQSWTTLIGDNAAGKSTILRSLALGLCSESDAVAFLKMLARPLRRHGSDKGVIHIELVDPDSQETMWIDTTVEEAPSGDERIRRSTEPEDQFPWNRLFLCGYGTNRSRKGIASYDQYSPLDAVRTLFDDEARLQNPELILLRQKNGLQQVLEERLLSIMMLDGARFDYTGKGPVIQGEWGDQPIRSLSDGYLSTLQWALDFFAWTIYVGRFGENGVDGGILLIDELEQHLHPRWQRHIVKRLREQFPTTQIFATTHTPLVAAGVADIESAQVVRLEGKVGGLIEAEVMQPQEFWGKRADQILTEAFDLITSRNPGSENDLDRYAALLGKDSRSEAEEAAFQALRVKLRDALALGETATEREAERIAERVLDELNTELDKEHLDFETRKLLQDLLRPEGET